MWLSVRVTCSEFECLREGRGLLLSLFLRLSSAAVAQNFNHVPVHPVSPGQGVPVHLQKPEHDRHQGLYRQYFYNRCNQGLNILVFNKCVVKGDASNCQTQEAVLFSICNSCQKFERVYTEM